MPLQITLVTEDYRGDHAADVRIALDADPNETIAALVDRASTNRRGSAPTLSPVDVIEIRVTAG